MIPRCLWPRASLIWVLLLTSWFAVASQLRANDTNTVPLSLADQTWLELKQASETPPEPLRQNPDRMLTADEINRYHCTLASRAGEMADQAKQFFIRYPEHPQAGAARTLYLNLLHTSVACNVTNRIAELKAVTAQLQQDPKLDESARFELSLRLLHSTVSGREHEGNDAMRAELEQDARQLARDYPGHPDGVNYLLNLARAAAPEKAAALARELFGLTSDAKIRTECQGLTNRLAAWGQVLELKLPSADGKVLDLQQMRGKVVCLFLWSSESRFAQKAMWAVNGLYHTYHAQGLEIWGLNFDSQPAAAGSLLKDYQIEWPQYYDFPDGGVVQKRFGLYSLPTVWLVDKKGVLRELKAEREPAPLIKQLLAE